VWRPCASCAGERRRGLRPRPYPAGAPGIDRELPEAIAAAVIEFLATTLIRQPARAGKPLRDDLAGVWSARRGTYRVLCRIREDPREVIVLRVEHRRDAYRPL